MVLDCTLYICFSSRIKLPLQKTFLHVSAVQSRHRSRARLMLLPRACSPFFSFCITALAVLFITRQHNHNGLRSKVRSPETCAEPSAGVVTPGSSETVVCFLCSLLFFPPSVSLSRSRMPQLHRKLRPQHQRPKQSPLLKQGSFLLPCFRFSCISSSAHQN